MRLEPEAVVALLTGADTWRTRPEPRLGLREIVFSDGPAGVRGPGWDARSTAALIPSAGALAALWDEDRVAAVGALLGDEARRKGVHVLLAPNLNLHRAPLAGRHFECLSEDPLLAGRTGAALVRGIQSRGVAACAKHFVANDSETERLTLDARLAPRVLREVYLAPFEAAVRAGVWTVMSAYNAVNGVPMSEHPLLTDPLCTEWGFDGVIVSDWGAVRSTVPAARSAQGLVMPGPRGPWGPELARTLADGRVPGAAVADKVTRLLRLATRVGAAAPDLPNLPDLPDRPNLPDRPDGAPDAAGPTPTTPVLTAAAPPPDDPAVRELLRETAAASFVLLENRTGLLPLAPGRIRSLALIGEHASAPRVQGGGSSEVFPHHVVTPLDALRVAAPAAGITPRHAPGPRRTGPEAVVPLDGRLARDPADGAPGVRLRVLDADGRVLHTEALPGGRVPEPELPPGAHTVELLADLLPDVDGPWTLGLAGFGLLELFVDGRPVLAEEHLPLTADPAVIHVRPPHHTVTVPLRAGRVVRVHARRALAPGTGRATALVLAPPAPPAEEAVAEAVAAARAADVAVVCVGTAEGAESEGHDRTTLALPAGQDALVRAVVAANPRTVVVVNAGAPVELPWRDEVAAVLLTWFPGQEYGHALADVLLGRREPGGRLPTTWPAALADTPPPPSPIPVAGVLRYTEGLHLGHRGRLRHGPRPAWWFGHGLGYTTWEHERAARPVRLPDGDVEVEVLVRNTGRRAGRELVQVYLARPDSAVERPVRWLAGWAAVTAGPGERVAARIRIPARALAHWSERARAWCTEPGAFTVLVGRHADDLPLRTTLVVPGAPWGAGAGQRRLAP
ncbi:glycoside hydrolase family 3 C-terminal domain-containing protein (plasmid) [Streptomyces sp. BI20]|uniref:glycoside hydrolase family 3 C-terminal domain-containing protein n=1 Tax=Streptomyces sp. BI20 TaxID=3403460 RepID=UPI003C713438